MLKALTSGRLAQFNSSSQSLSADREIQDLQEAMAAVLHIVNDDLEAAETGLKAGESSYHKLGLGVVNFLRAVLGFEKDVMKEAQESIWAAEAEAMAEQKRVKRDPNAFKSAIYEQGSEFVLTNCECLLMGALLGVISESVTEALKGFYNLRKAYMALSVIVETEKKYIDSLKTSASASSASTPQAAASAANTRPSSKTPSLHDASLTSSNHPPARSSVQIDADGDAFVDASEEHEDTTTTDEHLGKTEVDGIVKDLTAVNIQTTNDATVSDPGDTTFTATDISVFVHPVDIYVHSGVNLCFGLMLLVLSMIPPAFGRILSIIGFHGDRTRGLQMVWQASKCDNINGALAGLALLAMYNGTASFCDILPERNPDLPADAAENLAGYPIDQLEALLKKMRHRFPNSGLWKLEEARMLANQRRVTDSLPMLKDGLNSPLKQLRALAVFERGMQAMASHDYELCATSFVECTKLNSWSHGLYYYIAGAAHIELHRKALLAGDSEVAESESKKAEDCFTEMRAHAGKRRFMARQFPFETFCIRKVSKWEERAKEWNVSLIQAAGVSPLEEMIYFWNGYKRMNDQMLKDSLDALSWIDQPQRKPTWEKYGDDEIAVRALLHACILRSLKDFEAAKKILQEDIISKDKNLFKGGNRDDYVQPVAHCEMATALWQERTHGGESEEGSAANIGRVREAQEWMEKCKNWETYTLDARMGLKVSTGLDTMKKWMARHEAVRKLNESSE